MQGRGLGTEARRAPPGPRSPAAGGEAPAQARRAFPGSELRRCPRDPERPLVAPGGPFAHPSAGRAPRPALAFP